MRTGAVNGKGTETVCPICGKTFRRKHKGQVFCNRACSASGRRTWNDMAKSGQIKSKEPRYCARCRKEIMDWTPGRKYCSKECATAIKAERKKAAMLEALQKGRKCIICGTHFIPAADKQWICSDACRKSAVDSEVFIRILRPSGSLKPEMQPVVGKIYKAKRGLGHNKQSIFWIIPGFGKFGVIIRAGEAEEVTV